MYLFIFMVSLLIANSLGQDYCPQKNTTECIISSQSCESNEILISGSGLCDGICPKCVTARIVDEICGGTAIPCRSGLKCATNAFGGSSCVIDSTQCLHLNYVPEATLEKYSWKPECDRDGAYKAVQCKGDRASGRCFCFSEQGDRIFGWDWWRNIAHMTCSCSRKRQKNEMDGKLSTLHCTQNGNYEELQCENDICWCAEPKTGDLQKGTVAVPYALWTLLPCYNVTQMGTMYLRQCESSYVAQEKIRNKFATHGATSITMDDIVCDYDGSYGSHMIEAGSAVCTWRDGTRIGSYAAPANQVSTMDCNCARDTKIFEENHLTLRMACGGNGNYVELQEANQRAFCVDRDGFNVTDLLPSTPSPNCDDFLYYKFT